LAILALDRNSSHLAEQMALKSFVAGNGSRSRQDADFDKHPLDIPASARYDPGYWPLRMLVASRMPQRRKSRAAQKCAGFG